MKIVSAGGGAVATVDCAQGYQKTGKVYREVAEKMDTIGARWFSVEPTVYRPRPGIPLARNAAPHWNRDR